MDTAPLAGWGNFYVITGSSAAALTGLQFVVMALAAEARERQASSDTVNAFGTPTVVHFGAVLLVAAILSAPWRAIEHAAFVVGACGFAGVLYSLVVVRRERRQKGYQPVLEDWVWYAALPFIGYGGLAGAAIALVRDVEHPLFVIAASSLLLLFIGIHNAWDTVTYLAVQRIEARTEDRGPAERKP